MRQRIGQAEQDLARERALEQDAAAALSDLAGEAQELTEANASAAATLTQAEEQALALADTLAEQWLTQPWTPTDDKPETARDVVYDDPKKPLRARVLWRP